MVIGNGIIASAFKKYLNDSIVIFASGVSNSHETNKESFNREIKLLDEVISTLNDKKLIYFSTIMSDIINNAYCNHKLYIENHIKKHVKNYIIFKLPQVIGSGGNPNNIFNTLKHNAKNDKEIIVYNNTTRSLIDIDDVYDIVCYCIPRENNAVLNIAGIEKKSVLQIATYIISQLQSNSRVKVIKDHNILNSTTLNSEPVDLSIKELKINTQDYTIRIIKKYINEF